MGVFGVLVVMCGFGQEIVRKREGYSAQKFSLGVVFVNSKENFYLKGKKNLGKMPKKVVASKRSRGSSSSEFDKIRFILAKAKARFNDSANYQSGLKEPDFDVDVENPTVEYF